MFTSVAKRISIRIPDPDRHQNVTICSLAHCQSSLKISRKPVRKFLCKVANSQTNMQSNNGDYIIILGGCRPKNQQPDSIWGAGGVGARFTPVVASGGTLRAAADPEEWLGVRSGVHRGSGLWRGYALPHPPAAKKLNFSVNSKRYF